MDYEDLKMEWESASLLILHIISLQIEIVPAVLSIILMQFHNLLEKLY